ncbi:hypothetical protein [Polynucleobacter necessarius]|uniref:hypothetical protein n=1 Tax=Polynucleobacter necessarius TaxID=576610 RepID=UPI001E634D47|nr:hypothetical protein [Polynucleobacter necessarius]
MKKILVITAATIAIAGCPNMSNTEQRTLSGASIGAVAGGVGLLSSTAIQSAAQSVVLQLVQLQAMLMTPTRKIRLLNTMRVIRPERVRIATLAVTSL